MTLVNRALAKLLLVALAVIIVPWLATYVTAYLVARSTAPETVNARLAVLGDGVASEIGSYLDTGIPLGDAVGVSAYLGEDLQADTEIRAALVVTIDGRVVGRYLHAGPGESLPGTLGVDSDWNALRLNTISFQIAAGSQAVGRLILAYDSNVLTVATNSVTRSFLLVLVIAVILGFELILSSFRQVVLLPLHTVMAMERRAAERSFDRIAALPDNGPLVALVAAINKLVVAVNDRYARVRAHLLEIQELSFNPNAAGMVGTLRRQLDGAARFAPEGLGELITDHGDMFAGPVAFRAGIVVGIAGMLSVPAFVLFRAASVASAASAPAATVALLALAAILAAGVKPSRHRFFVPLAAGLAGLGLIAIPFIAARFIPLSALLATAGAVAMARAVMPSREFASVSRLVHGIAGIMVGAGVTFIDSGDRGHFFTIVIALFAVGAAAAQGVRFRAEPSASGVRLRWSTDWWGRFDLLLSVGSAWMFWCAIGYWAPATLAAIEASGEALPLPEVVFAGGAALGVGMMAALALLRAFPVRFGPESALGVTAALVATMIAGSDAFTGNLAVIVAVLCGIGLVGATALIVVRLPLRLLLLLGTALLAGAGGAFAELGPASGAASGALLAAPLASILTIAILGIVLASIARIWRLWPRRTGNRR